MIEGEYFYLPASPEAQQAFINELDQGAMKAMAVAASTPAANLDDYRRQLDFAAARGMTEVLSDDYTVFLEPVQDAPLKENSPDNMKVSVSGSSIQKARSLSFRRSWGLRQSERGCSRETSSPPPMERHWTDSIPTPRCR